MIRVYEVKIYKRLPKEQRTRGMSFEEFHTFVRNRFYRMFEHALADVLDADADLYADLDMTSVDMCRPLIVGQGEDAYGYEADFAISWPNDVCAHIGEVFADDDRRVDDKR